MKAGIRKKDLSHRPAGRFILLLVLVLLAGNLTACSSRDQSLDVGNAISISCSWWGNDIRHKYTLEGLDLFMEEHKDIQVQHIYGVWNGYEKRTKVFMLSNSEADVMQINSAWIKTYSPDGNGYYDLYRLKDVIDLSNYTEDELKFGEVDGKLNGLPIAFNTSTFFYNQDIFDRYGQELPKTWDDLFTAAKAIASEDMYLLGMERKHVFLMLNAYLEQNRGTTFFNEEGGLGATPDDIAFMLEFYKSMIDNRVLKPIDQFSANDFYNQNIAGSVCWVSDADRYCQQLSDEGTTVIVGDYPTMDGALRAGRYKKPASLYAISNITEHPEEAGKLLDFLVNDPEMAKLQGTEKGVPVSKSAIRALEEAGQTDNFGYYANQKMIEDSSDMEPLLSELENDSIITVFKTVGDDYRFDKADLNRCAEEIHKQVSEILGRD